MLARSVEVRGVVQGVGFRPFVWRLADRHGVTGWVRNRNGVVETRAYDAAGNMTQVTRAAGTPQATTVA